MQIIWHGYNCFSLKGKDITILIDPHHESLGLKLPKLKADIILISDSEKYSNKDAVLGEKIVIDWPGEYEIKDVFLKTINLNEDNQENKMNMIFTIDFEDMKICHLSDLNQTLSDKTNEEIGTVDILFLPVGGHNVLNAKKAHEVIEQIDPKIVIPMHYQINNLNAELEPVENFLKEVGENTVTKIESYKISKNNLPMDKTDFIILEPQI
ncbi:MAG: Zn-dependent hydrolase of the beta-lactamase fold-like protein [Candidatus Peregrinibacteria bacterium GW2011_GWA2_33_10]|nr:MAG: Zn-dependent hydrolase of the beta-lactamase fold-like protein [Candidatus Peregrinibacteria bacterium GW2011_GWA2_33_10]OGJ49261.1 MAG: hypothetical protein A2229_05660 [Candidatus Peregrinibacteria bacterium RIFOXYA2_FULL_33_7]